MDYSGIIERNPEVLGGKPIIKDTRISVELIVRKMSNGYSVEQLLESYPHLKREQIQACMAYAADLISGDVLFVTA